MIELYDLNARFFKECGSYSNMTLKTDSTTLLAVDLLVIRQNDRSVNKSLRLKRCLNAENNKPDKRRTCVAERLAI